VRLDPSLSTTNASGVNQFCLFGTDNNATVLATAAEFLYSPQYLWPVG
jgi:hypothetical protein